MILADTRHRLTRDDAQLAARLLASDSGDDLDALEARLTDEGIDAILDDPRLPGVLLRDPRGAHASFTLFAYVMIRHALRQAGERDRSLADYVSAIVLHFGMRDRAFRISSTWCCGKKRVRICSACATARTRSRSTPSGATRVSATIACSRECDTE